MAADILQVLRPHRCSRTPTCRDRVHMWLPGPALLLPPQVFAGGAQSARLRRVEEEVAELRLDDVYGGLSMPWQVDRRDINGPHGTEWPEGSPADLWVSTDSGSVCFAPAAAAPPGQYHKAVGEEWRCYEPGSAPGNAGGFHCCCVDTAQPGASWSLVAKLADFGLALGRDAGLRVEFAALVRNDCDAIVASMGPHDECRSLFFVDQVELHDGRLSLVDPAEPWPEPQAAAEAEDAAEDGGFCVPSGMGAGYYPVLLSRDANEQICRVTVVFHPGRVAKVCRRFPPAVVAEAGAGDAGG